MKEPWRKCATGMGSKSADTGKHHFLNLTRYAGQVEPETTVGSHKSLLSLFTFTMGSALIM